MRMQVFVTTPSGMNIPIRCKKSDTVETLKDEVECNTGIEMHLQRLIYNGKELEDDKTLGDYEIGRNCTVVLEFTEDGVLEKTWRWRYNYKSYLPQFQRRDIPPKPNGTLPVKSTNTGKKRNIVRGKF